MRYARIYSVNILFPLLIINNLLMTDITELTAFKQFLTMTYKQESNIVQQDTPVPNHSYGTLTKHHCVICETSCDF